MGFTNITNPSMNNAERIAKHVTKYGQDGLLIHTIPNTPYWLVCEKFAQDVWKITLCNPMKNANFTIGTINDEQHYELWKEITTAKIEQRANLIRATQELKNVYKNFL